MNRIQSRDMSDRNQEDLWDDWVASEVMITTVWPQLATPVTNIERNVTSSAGVELQPTQKEQDISNQSSVSPRLLNRLLIGAIVLLSIAVIVLSLLLWLRSQRNEPKQQEEVRMTWLRVIAATRVQTQL
jgi:preprotein translocase subunit SecF